ncbi:hypothetical protein BLA39750_01047 [Burkholderia lata]|uniref:Prolyl 4-hydroxylase alpha subunit Fe(2+) 2OG dioxygenase domain-containing protein n=1 Tax=Burkholderia lata (strain ATCC 17760 / DSM 23089 / LMG 22485 / NCIMB 9086 / R18194 / 383) TaxID=482957 RepID=A0A6P2VB17_BURL3|nr:hypothetical protein [Burkholderia lata]VWC78838.1 hypothetical protein BLA39750_01047 [Burkholderia lata]
MSTIAIPPKPAPPIGPILGRVALPDSVVRGSARLAEEFYTAAEENEFCGDAVETYAIPLWARTGGAVWLPDLASLGYRKAESGFRGREEVLVATAAVDAHTDDEGLVLMIVLHNQGLTFRQGKVRHVPQAGEWFLFDDRKPHGVTEAPGRSVFVGWNIPIVPI